MVESFCGQRKSKGNYTASDFKIYGGTEMTSMAEDKKQILESVKAYYNHYHKESEG